MNRILCAALIAMPLFAQDYNRKSLSVGVGGAIPDVNGAMDGGIAVSLNFGYRFTRYIQADIGFQSSFNKDYRDYYPKSGAGSGTTTEFFVPAGGRIVIPVWNGRIEPSFGLGGVYAYDKGENYGNNHQGGVYGLGGITYALDSHRRHRVGVTVRYINIMSAGRPHPEWVNVMGEYTYSWGE